MKEELHQFANTDYAVKMQRFFKTGKGEYGEGDIFIGVRTPDIRKIAKDNVDIEFDKLIPFITSTIHEERLLGLIILCKKYEVAEKAKDQTMQKHIYDLYCEHFTYVNNWDLVDVTCPHIIGKYLFDKDRNILFDWARSDNLWIRRIAMVTNWWFIRKGDLSTVFKIAELLLEDEHDLIHKAVGWMLREAGKKDFELADDFIKEHYRKMPRTMLRYAIEKHPETLRQNYLKR